MPIDQWVLSVFWQGKVFLQCKFKEQFKILLHKSTSIFLGNVCGSESRNHFSCETGLKSVRFCANAL